MCLCCWPRDNCLIFNNNKEQMSHTSKTKPEMPPFFYCHFDINFIDLSAILYFQQIVADIVSKGLGQTKKTCVRCRTKHVSAQSSVVVAIKSAFIGTFLNCQSVILVIQPFFAIVKSQGLLQQHLSPGRSRVAHLTKGSKCPQTELHSK